MKKVSWRLSRDSRNAFLYWSLNSRLLCKAIHIAEACTKKIIFCREPFRDHNSNNTGLSESKVVFTCPIQNKNAVRYIGFTAQVIQHNRSYKEHVDLVTKTVSWYLIGPPFALFFGRAALSCLLFRNFSTWAPQQCPTTAPTGNSAPNVNYCNLYK